LCHTQMKTRTSRYERNWISIQNIVCLHCWTDTWFGGLELCIPVQLVKTKLELRLIFRTGTASDFQNQNWTFKNWTQNWVFYVWNQKQNQDICFGIKKWWLEPGINWRLTAS
jgi:hypothetical protein